MNTHDPPPSPTVVVHLSDAVDLQRARQLVVDAGTEAGLDRQRRADSAVAVSEVITNALTHGAGTDGHVAMTISVASGALLIDVTDRGSGFSGALPATPPSPAQPGGRGLWLTRQLCDRVDIRSSADGTHVRLIFLISQA